MTTIAEWYKIDDAELAKRLHDGREKLNSIKGEAVLDFRQ